jgi:hypothetical protein
MVNYANLIRIDEENKTSRPATERTDSDFRRRVDGKHHHNLRPIELEKLPGIDMIGIFTEDIMHLFCRGAMVRFFQFLLGYHNSVRVLQMKRTDFINGCGKQWKAFTFPMEFNRRPNSFSKWSSFKCTELRMFGLYGMEMIVRKFCGNPVIQQALYALAMATRIICDPQLFREHWRKAKTLFDVFLQNTAAVWGNVFISLAIHQLRHLPEETVRLNLPADAFSCFKFENALGKIKRSIRSKSHPLLNFSSFLSQQTSFVSRAGREPTITAGKFPRPLKKVKPYENRFSVIQFRNYRLSSLRKADSFFGANGKIRQFMYVEVEEDGKLIITSKAYSRQRAAYWVQMADDVKIFSTEARICEVDGQDRPDIIYSDDVSGKYMVNDFYGKLVAYPLLHT